MKRITIIIIAAILFIWPACSGNPEQVTNPWLVPFQERHASTMSRSQMRAMARLARFYAEAEMDKEYVSAMTTAVELFAGDRNITFELINALIDKINNLRIQIASNPSPELKSELEGRYEELLRIMRSACNQIPYNSELYFRTASLQFLRAEEGGDREKYKDAINFLKRAIASDSGHLESYHLLAMCYERLGDEERALRFWRLFEVIYEMAPEIMGREFITDSRKSMHNDAVRRIAELEASGYE